VDPVYGAAVECLKIAGLKPAKELKKALFE